MIPLHLRTALRILKARLRALDRIIDSLEQLSENRLEARFYAPKPRGLMFQPIPQMAKARLRQPRR
jgi:hypothetical protein